jgi:protein kinase C substrate 80K-H
MVDQHHLGKKDIFMLKNCRRFDKWDNNYTVMHYTGGQTCWQGPARSTAVTLVCSGTSEMKISNVDEPSRCVYTMVMTTPAACKKSDLEELEKQLAQFL